MDFPDKPTNAGQIAGQMTVPLSFVKSAGPVTQFLAVGLAGLAGSVVLGSALVGSILPIGVLAGAAVYIAALALAVPALRTGYPHAAIGLCNTVTLLRLMLAAALIAALVSPGAGVWPLFVVAAVAFGLDGLDGWLARRERLVSAFGARLDMEVDSVLALVLALLAWQGGEVGSYVVLLGLPRYLFGVAQLKLEWLNGALPERFSRKVVCVVQISALLLVLFPPVASPVTDVVAGLAAFALIWSFWIDVRWLYRARA